MSKSSKTYGILATTLYFTALTTGVGAAWGLVTIKSNPAKNKQIKQSYNNLMNQLEATKSWLKTLDSSKYDFGDKGSLPNIQFPDWKSNNPGQTQKITLSSFFANAQKSISEKINEIENALGRTYQESELKIWKLDLIQRKQILENELLEKRNLLENKLKNEYDELAIKVKNKYKQISSKKLDESFKTYYDKQFQEINNLLFAQTSSTEGFVLNDNLDLTTMNKIRDKIKEQNRVFDYKLYSAEIAYAIESSKNDSANAVIKDLKDFIVQAEKKDTNNNTKALHKDEFIALLNNLEIAIARAKDTASKIDNSISNIAELESIDIKNPEGNDWRYSSSLNNLIKVIGETKKKLKEIEEKESIEKELISNINY